MNSAYFKFSRILASMIDGFFMLVIFLGICAAPTIVLIKDIQSGNSLLNDILWLSFSAFGSFCVWIVYLFGTALIFRGATLGMKTQRLVYTRTNGNPMSYRSILFRETMTVLCIVFSLGFTLLFDPISLICSENGKNFYDIFFSLKVVSVNDL